MSETEFIAVTARELVGGWQYSSWDITYDDGRVTHPFGSDAAGFILYTADGCMSANIMAGGRPGFAAGNPRRASDAERAHAFDGYFSYAGRWRLEGGQVLHDVTVALNPAFVGARQWRDPVLKRNVDGTLTLSLSAAESLPVGRRVHRILWTRAVATPISTEQSIVDDQKR